ncbi:MAG: hypothetical protein WCO51_00640 [bacterium]|jgi:hypothetical protein
MELAEFRSLVYSQFGPDLHRATPANVRDFLAILQKHHVESQPLILNEKQSTLEDILKDFFARALDMPKDEAIILLWVLGLELSFGIIEDHLENHLPSFFKSLEDTP